MAICRGGCNKCTNHCACEKDATIRVVVTPPKTRNNEKTKKKIKLVIETELFTPTKIREAEVRKQATLTRNLHFKKIKALVPNSKSWSILTHHSLTSTIVESTTRFWRAFVSGVEELVETIARSVLVRASPSGSIHEQAQAGLG